LCQKAGDDTNAVLNWTLHNGTVSVVAPLCFPHGAPLTELVNLVGPAPQTNQLPKVAARLPKARPLTNWKKPED
jgi:hypothetical protein